MQALLEKRIVRHNEDFSRPDLGGKTTSAVASSIMTSACSSPRPEAQASQSLGAEKAIANVADTNGASESDRAHALTTKFDGDKSDLGYVG